MKYPRLSLLLAAGALALSAALTACGSAEPLPQRSSAGEDTETATVETPTVKLGDCRLEAASGLPTEAEVVPCAEPHDEEVFYEITMPDGAFAQDAVEAATEECVGDPFTTFVGVSKEESALGVYPIPPMPETWDQPGGRVIFCVLFDPAGQTEGSLAGAAR